MTRAVPGLLVVCLVCIVAIGIAGGQAQQPPASLIQNGKVETRQGASVDREIAAVAGPDPVWVVWRVPMVAGDRDLCNSYYSDRSVYSRGYVMDWNPPGRATSASGTPQVAPPTGPVPLEAGTGLLVLVRILDGGVERVRTLADDCPIDAGGRAVHWLGGITSAESLRFLEGLTRIDRIGRTDRVTYESRRNVASSAFSAISLHRDAAAVDALRALTRDADARIRAEAVYWFVQRGGAAVITEVTKIIETDADDSVKRRGVSGLARLPASDSVPPLLQLARASANPAVRKEAVSALSTSKDPRAMSFMEELIKR